MEVVFRCLSEGKRLYSVRRQGLEIFVGSIEECARFAELHHRKVREEREHDRLPVRPPAFRPRVRRMTAPRAG